jgi:hypothetical protein
MDLMAKNVPPLTPPKWYFFEGKSTLGGDVVPYLTEKQGQFRKWLKDNLQKAKNGVDKGGTWSDLKGDKKLYDGILDELEMGNFEFIKADVFMDTAGKLAKEIGFTAIK